MLTGDNRITASVIAEEAGVDDFIAEATPEDKIKVIRNEQDERSNYPSQNSSSNQQVKTRRGEEISYV